MLSRKTIRESFEMTVSQKVGEPGENLNPWTLKRELVTLNQQHLHWHTFIYSSDKSQRSRLNILKWVPKSVGQAICALKIRSSNLTAKQHGGFDMVYYTVFHWSSIQISPTVWQLSLDQHYATARTSQLQHLTSLQRPPGESTGAACSTQEQGFKTKVCWTQKQKRYMNLDHCQYWSCIQTQIYHVERNWELYWLSWTILMCGSWYIGTQFGMLWLIRQSKSEVHNTTIYPCTTHMLDRRTCAKKFWNPHALLSENLVWLKYSGIVNSLGTEYSFVSALCFS